MGGSRRDRHIWEEKRVCVRPNRVCVCVGLPERGQHAVNNIGVVVVCFPPFLSAKAFPLTHVCAVRCAVVCCAVWLQVKPGRHWYNAYLGATQAAMQQQQQQPPLYQQQQQQQQYASTAAGAAGFGFTPQAYANMVWALGKLQRRPGSDWAADLYAVTGPQLAGFSPQGLANLGLGLANMNLVGGLPRPDKPWVDAFVAAAVEQLPGFTSQGLANLLW